jgi:N-acetylmuramoyl-L-alanine amidase
MLKGKRNKLTVDLVLLMVFSCAAPRPTANAPDLNGQDTALIGISEASGEPGGDYLASSSPLARNLFLSAVELDRALHERPMETRTKGDYLRVIDGYAMVNRVGTDERLAGESLWRAANTMREIADTMGDYGLYRKAIKTFHQIIDEHPRSNYVGEALLGIAQICEENLQDLKGAAEAYRAIVGYFPNSVLARESRAVLSRFESELLERNGTPDVVMPTSDEAAGPDVEGGSGITLENVRNYTGPDYSRIVLDLSDEAALDRKPAQGDRITIELRGVRVAPSLYGRRFIIRDSRFLKQIVVRSAGQDGSGGTKSTSKGPGVNIELVASKAAELSAFQLSNPARLVIDLRAADAMPARQTEVAPHNPHPSSSTAAAPVQAAAKVPSIGNDARLQERSLGIATATLPEVDVSNLSSLQQSLKSGAANDEKRPAGSSQNEATKTTVEPTSQVRCIVIDPGHGGHDTGTIGEGGLKEKDLVLAVALRLRDYIRKNFPQIEVVMTRDSDRFIALEERTAIANSKRADLFISVHANAAPTHSASGVETYFLSPGRAASEDIRAAQRENAAPVVESRTAADQQPKPVAPQAAGAEAAEVNPPEEKLRSAVASVSSGNRIAQSQELAGYIQSGLVRGVGSLAPKTAANRGVKHAQFIVLLGAAMPSVLAEISFVSNPHDEDLLRTDQFRDRIAVSLFAGLRAYLNKRESVETAKNKKKS